MGPVRATYFSHAGYRLLSSFNVGLFKLTGAFLNAANQWKNTFTGVLKAALQ